MDTDRTGLTPYVPRLLLYGEDQPIRQLEASLALLDVSGFTALSERLADRGKVGSEEVTHLLNRGFGELISIAAGWGGDLLKFGGDSLLLLFTGDDHPQRAASSLVQMRDALPRATRTSHGVLQMSAGLHAGPVHLFLCGESHLEMIVAGPAASRVVDLEASAQPGEILLSETTAARLDGSDGERLPNGTYSLASVSYPPGDVSPTRLPDFECSRFIPTALRRHLAAGEPEGEHRMATIAFVRFDDIDQTILQGGARHAWKFLDSSISEIQEIVDRFSVCLLGSDLASNGGKLILSAGAPDATDNDEERMLLTVREIVDRTGFRAGVNRGRVFAGDVGTPVRRTYTVIGDAVNVAARLVEHAAPGEMLATEGTVTRSPTAFALEELPSLQVKGRAGSVTAYRVGETADHRGGLFLEDRRLVGRSAEMEVLLDTLQQSLRGRGALVEVSAPAGAGKTSLLAGVLERAEDFRTLGIACDQYESTTAYAVFRRLLRDLIEIDEEDDPEVAGDKLSRHVEATEPDLGPWVPLLALVVDARVPPTPETTRLKPELRRARLHSAVGQLLASVLSTPTLLLVEDAHWMDEASSELLSHLAQQVTARPWAILVTRRPYRSGFSADPGDGVSRLELGPLDADAAFRLATEAMGDQYLTRADFTLLFDRSGGNPLFLLELLKALREPGPIADLPDTVEAIITARIDELDPSDRTVLRYASVLGKAFRVGLLAESLADERPVLEEADIWHRFTTFIEPVEPGVFRFRHDLFREVAYEGLSYRRRRHIHERVGKTLESQSPRPDEEAELLSLHFHRAELFEESWHYSVTAGDRSRTKHAVKEAADFYDRALEAAPHLPELEWEIVTRVWESLGDVSELAGNYERAAGSYRRAHRLASREGAHRPELFLKQGVIRERLGKYSQALRWYSRGLQVAESDSRDKALERVQLGLAYAGVRLRQGRFEDCVTWCYRVLDDAEGIEAKAELAHAYYLLHLAYTSMARPERAAFRNLALPIYEELGDLIGMANTLNNLGIDAYYEGRWNEAMNYYRRSKEAREEAGDVVGAATQTNNIGEILSDQGHLDEAEGLFREVYAICSGTGYRLVAAVAKSNMGRVAARRGSFELAALSYDQASEEFRQIGAQSFILETMSRSAELALLEGDFEEASRLASRGLEDIRRGGADPMVVLEAMLLRIGGTALIQADQVEEGESWLRESLGKAESVDATYELALTLGVLARASQLQGQFNPALAERSRRVFDQLGVVSVPEAPLQIA